MRGMRLKTDSSLIDMIKLLQKTLDRLVRKDGLPFRYIIRFYGNDVAGFGGLKNCAVELYRRSGNKFSIVFSSAVKGKSDEVEELACIEVMSWLLSGRNNGVE